MKTLQILGPVLILALASCASRSVEPYTRAEIQENIYFHYFRKLDDSRLRQRSTQSSYHLLRSTYPEFLLDLRRLEPGRGLFDTLPQGLMHGDFHMQQMAWRDGQPVLDDWDTVEWGSLWIDLIRLDVSARLTAQEVGLRGYPEDSCIEAYSARFVSDKALNQGRPLPPPEAQDKSVQDFSQHPVWIKAAHEREIPPELLAAFREWLGAHPQLGPRPTDPMKRLVFGVGSYLNEKVIVLDSQKQLWELKEVDTHPMESIGWRPSKNGCARYEKLAQVSASLPNNSGAGSVKACWSWQGRTFTLLKWDLDYWSPSTADFKTLPQLVNHTQWMCERLAEFHKASLDEVSTRHWALALKSRTPLRTRLIELSTEAFKTYQEGYRMILRK
jgi:hypothetical protein